MDNIGTHLILAAIGVVGIAAQAMSSPPPVAHATQLLDRPAVIMPATDILHQGAVNLPLVHADLS